MRVLAVLPLVVLVATGPLAAAAERAGKSETKSGKATAGKQSGDEAAVAVARLKDANGKHVGDALLRETPNGVLVTVRATSLPPGAHAFHVHEHGKCEPPFESAGAHFNPTGKHHGYETRAASTPATSRTSSSTRPAR